MVRFFSNMKIGFKIGLGFLVVLAVLAAVSLNGLTGLNDASEGFAAYRELAGDSNLTGRMQANYLMMHGAMEDFVAEESREAAGEFGERYDLLAGLLVQADEAFKGTERADLLAQVHDQVEAAGRGFEELRSLVQAKKEAQGVIVRTGGEIVSALESSARTQRQSGSLEMGYQLQEFLANILEARLLMANYLYQTRDPADAENSLGAFSRLSGSMAHFAGGLADSPFKREMEKVQTHLGLYVKGATEVLDANKKQVVLVDEMGRSGHSLADLLERINLSVMAEQDELGPALQAENAAIQSRMLIFSVAAVLLGVAMAVIITLAITLPLKRSIRAAGRVARGDFVQSAEEKRKDELGDIIRAVDSIQATIQGMKREFDAEVEAVRLGELNRRGDASGFQGGFAELIHGVNSMADAYSTYIESVPLPLMTMNRDMELLFANQAARRAFGKEAREVKGAKCWELMRAGDCRTDRCACAKAIASGGKQEAETTARPGGSEMEIRYTGVPIEKDGQVVGVLELAIDETAIKRAQKKMRHAALEADHISQRLSSSSEELAAQVEQVGRGSEVQRDRVQETATAMEQMNATVVEVAKNASNAAGISERASQMAESGAAIVNQAVEAIDQVHASTRRMQADMGKLGEKAEAIGQVMDVIADIADQTNLLALNAAIEAARAGDAGRGFAVVADEVRKLAEKTMSATHEVGQSIRAIQDAARDNIGSMNEATGYVEKATELANQSGGALGRIVDLVRQSAVQVEGIASASEEQSAASEQISGALEEINRVVAETTEGMVQSATAVQELAQMSGELAGIIRELQADGRDGKSVGRGKSGLPEPSGEGEDKLAA